MVLLFSLQLLLAQQLLMLLRLVVDVFLFLLLVGGMGRVVWESGLLLAWDGSQDGGDFPKLELHASPGRCRLTPAKTRL